MLTCTAGGASPARGAGAVEGAARLLAHSPVGAGPCHTRVVHHLAVESRETLRTRALVLVRSRVLARASVLARLVSSAVVQVCNRIRILYKYNSLPIEDSSLDI